MTLVRRNTARLTNNVDYPMPILKKRPSMTNTSYARNQQDELLESFGELIDEAARSGY